MKNSTLEELSKDEQWAKDEETAKGLEPCPFCGEDLSKFPFFMVIQPVHTEAYLLAKMFKKQFLGSDNYFSVICIRCGSQGQRGSTRQLAADYWNRRC